jgi:hypothetical protein
MPYEKVIAIGDSFTRGDELSDCQDQIHGVTNQPIYFSKHTWPALIAKQLAAEYDCIAVGGRGNAWINWSANQTLSESKNCLVIVNWTYFGRFDYLDLEDQWTTITPNHLGSKEKEYYQRFDNDLWNLNRNLQLMYATFSMLENNGIDFISTCHDNSFKQTVDTIRKVTPTQKWGKWRKALQPLIDYVVPRIIEFEGLTFKEWSGKHGYPIGPGGHPLEKAHTEAARYINTYVIEGTKNGHR